MDKRTIVNQIEIQADGTVQVRFAKQIMDGEEIISNQWHRTMFDVSVNVDDQLTAMNTNLVDQLGYPEISIDDIKRLKSFINLARKHA